MTADSGFFQIYPQTAQKYIDVVLILKPGAQGEADSQKNKTKISRYCPFQDEDPMLGLYHNSSGRNCFL
jgi:hypothetical protein